MYKKITLLSLFAAVSLSANSELDALKAEVEKQQKSIESLMQKEDSTLDAKMSKKSSSSFSQNAYLPDIALILNMSMLGRSVNNSDYEAAYFAGFTQAGEAELPFNKNRGFNFNYAEVAMHSMVDPYFEAFAIFHLHPDAFEIEEAYVTTTSLPDGLRLKMGKFRSAFGRINEKHHHAWNFDEQPVIYKALFGPDMISDAGVQLQWVAPTDTYIMIGSDAMQGSNERSFGDPESNHLYVGYLKSSIDINDDLSLLGGVSLAHGQTEAKKDSDIYGVDLTLRNQLSSYSALSWQSEYLQRKKAGVKQAGLYSELVYQYNKNYSGGVRYEKITKNSIDTDKLDKYTAMLEYKPFPFSRIRLEYSHDSTKFIGAKQEDIDTVMLTLNIATGAHGAHAY